MPGERGAALLEVIVALVILFVAGTATVTLTDESLAAAARARDAEAELRSASAFLDAVSLWTGDDLDRHLGDRRQGRWLMRVDRPAPRLYDVALSDSAGGRVLLRTSIYRSEESQ